MEHAANSFIVSELYCLYIHLCKILAFYLGRNRYELTATLDTDFKYSELLFHIDKEYETHLYK